jgi:hypothetical protein
MHGTRRHVVQKTIVDASGPCFYTHALAGLARPARVAGGGSHCFGPGIEYVSLQLVLFPEQAVIAQREREIAHTGT